MLHFLQFQKEYYSYRIPVRETWRLIIWYLQREPRSSWEKQCPMHMLQKYVCHLGKLADCQGDTNAKTYHRHTAGWVASAPSLFGFHFQCSKLSINSLPKQSFSSCPSSTFLRLHTVDPAVGKGQIPFCLSPLFPFSCGVRVLWHCFTNQNWPYWHEAAAKRHKPGYFVMSLDPQGTHESLPCQMARLYRLPNTFLSILSFISSSLFFLLRYAQGTSISLMLR